MIAVIAAAVTLAAAGITGGILAARSDGSHQGAGGAPSHPAGTLRLLKTMVMPGAGEADAIAFSPDGTMLAASDIKGPATLWDTATGRQITTLPYGIGVDSLAFSPDGKTLAVTDGDARLDLWNVADHTTIAALTGVFGQGIAFSPDGRTLAVGERTSVRLLDIATRTWTAALTAPGASDINAVAFSPDGTMLAGGDGLTDTAYVWSLKRQNLLATLPPPNRQDAAGPGNWIAFSADSRILAVGDGGGLPGERPGTRLWDAASRKVTATLTDPAAGGVDGVAFSPAGETLAVADVGDTAYLWNAGTRTTVAAQDDPGGANVDGIAYSRSGALLATSDSSGHIYLWAARSG